MFSLLLPIIYLSFISLGLPDSVLGAAWPTMQAELSAPVSAVGIVSMLVSVFTIISSLLSDRVNRRFGTGRVTAVSVAMTAFALFGFSFSRSFPVLCLFAIPYGFGAGGVDASLNNYVALHYASRHMSWLHCMWGVGTTVGPLIMGRALAWGQGWSMGYRYVGALQVIICILLFLSLPLWKKSGDGEPDKNAKSLTLPQIIALPGAKQVMLSFFCYCAVEQTALLWGSSYLTACAGVSPQQAAALGSLFCLGITAGRFASGFITYKLNDTQMIRLGEGIIALGALAMLLPLVGAKMLGLILVGLGCAPIYPSTIHSTPALFSADKSQAVIGVQMASAYVGTVTMPPLFGLIAQYVNVSLLPIFFLVVLALEVLTYERLVRSHNKA